MFYAAEKQVFLRQIFESDYKQCTVFSKTPFFTKLILRTSFKKLADLN